MVSPIDTTTEPCACLANFPVSIFISMPALSCSLGLYINKVGTFFARTAGSDLPSIHAEVIAFSNKTGEPLGILEGNALTEIKCAAVTAVVTNYCAAPDASVLAIIGAGVQARQQFLGVCAVRDIKEIRIYNRSLNKLKNFVDEIRVVKGDTIKVMEFDSIDRAIESADVIGTATAAAEPISNFSNLQSRVHINCMGSHTSDSREIPLNILEESLLVVEDVPTAIEEAGEVHRSAVDLHRLTKLTSAELQEVRTIFSSTGYALLDLITVAHVLGR